MVLSCRFYALVALPPGKDTLDGHQGRFGHLGEEKLIALIGNWNRANSHGHNLLFRKIDNRRCCCTEFAVIWSLDIAGDFTIGEYNAGERKHQKEKGQAGMVQRVRWAHIGLLNLLTFKWRVELGNAIQRMRRGYRGREAMRQCRGHTSSGAPGRNSIQPDTRMNEKWRHRLDVLRHVWEETFSFIAQLFPFWF